MNKYYVMCSVFHCWETYEVEHQHTECPRCGVSRTEVIRFKSNNLELINQKKIDREIEDLYTDEGG